MESSFYLNLFLDATSFFIWKSFPPKNPIVFARTKLSISNEESYLARSKKSCEFHKRNGHFNSQHITLLNVSMTEGKC